MKLKTSVAIVAVAALLSACGGGGGSSGTSAFGKTSSSTTTTTTSTNVTSNTSGSVVLSLTSSTISASQPATVTAVVKDSSGAPIAGALVQFGLSGSTSTIAQLSPASAITDANGQAAATLTPATGATSGAAYVSASADTAAGTLTAKSAFSVSATNVILNSVAVVPGSISAYGSSSVNIGVTGASSTNPVTVNISSTCATGGKATISPATLTLTGATGTVTYQDKACSATDRINVQIAGTTQQQSADLIVAAPATQSIQYSSVDNANICLLGTGCPSVANVVFKVVNVSGAGQSGERVDFSLDSASSNFADLGSQFGTTAADGTVTVSVASRQTPTPLRVTAKLHSNMAIQTVSNVLTISGGLPVAGLTENHTGISFAASKYALNYNVDGDVADLTLRLTDRYGAGAVDGTAVSLVSDGGTVVPAYCVTKDGSCGVKLYVTNPRPTNGRVHILAYAKGQEYFVDTNGNGTFDVGTETIYDDVPVGVCNDKNENGVCDLNSGEFIVGVSTNPDTGNGTWDNAGTAYARLNRLLFFSRTDLSPRVYKVSGGACTSTLVDNAYMTVTMGSATRAFLQFCVRDGNVSADSLGGNPLMSGSTITATTTSSTFSAAVDNSPIPAVVGGPTMHTMLIQNTSTATPPVAITAGKADIKFTMGGSSITLPNAVTVNP